VVEAQGRIGSDIAMVLDECPPGDAPREAVEEAVRRTTRWARLSLVAPRRDGQSLFAIVQGALDAVLRRSHLEELAALGFDGLALGGFAVGEEPERRGPVLAEVAPRMPADRPRYLMGLGTPGDLFDAVRAGIDMFDCVLPTRNARNGQAFTASGRITIKQSRYREDAAPLEDGCPCPACRRFSRAYLRHLYVCGEILAARLLTAHNLSFYARWMSALRAAVLDGTLEGLEAAARRASGPAQP
jgi:queuine tRNA-ribosyltransferase